MAKRELKPLKISCTSTDCDNNLHCFKSTQQMKRRNEQGKCRKCGVDLIDWKRVHKRNLSDVKHTFDSLKKEYFRHHYWHKDIDLRAINHARRKGRILLKEAAERRIRKSVGPAEPYRDGYQTPFEGNSIYYAQHATACCCRKCMEYWHNIPLGRDLTEKEVKYVTELVMLYINEKLPTLTVEGEKVPPIRRKKRQS